MFGLKRLNRMFLGDNKLGAEGWAGVASIGMHSLLRGKFILGR